MDKIAKRLKTYIDTHPFNPGDSDCETVLDQLYQAYKKLSHLLFLVASSPYNLQVARVSCKPMKRTKFLGY